MKCKTLLVEKRDKATLVTRQNGDNYLTAEESYQRGAVNKVSHDKHLIATVVPFIE